MATAQNKANMPETQKTLQCTSEAAATSNSDAKNIKKENHTKLIAAAETNPSEQQAKQKEENVETEQISLNKAVSDLTDETNNSVDNKSGTVAKEAPQLTPFMPAIKSFSANNSPSSVASTNTGKNGTQKLSQIADNKPPSQAVSTNNSLSKSAVTGDNQKRSLGTAEQLAQSSEASDAYVQPSVEPGHTTDHNTANQWLPEALDTTDQRSSEAFDTTDKSSTEKVDKTDQSSANAADTADQSSANATDTADQGVTYELDITDQRSAERVDTTDQRSSGEVNRTDQSSAEAVNRSLTDLADTTDQSSTEETNTTDQSEGGDVADQSSSGTIEQVNHRRLQSEDERRSTRHSLREQKTDLPSQFPTLQDDENQVVDVQIGATAFDTRDLEARDGGGEVYAPFDVQLLDDENQPSADAEDAFLADMPRLINNRSGRVFAEMIRHFRWGRNDCQPRPDLCLLCWTRRPDVIFFDCHHIQICHVCVTECRVCPRCGQNRYAIFDPDYAQSS